MACSEWYLQEALGCANTRRGFCAPNPSVGAVIVKDDMIIGQGQHWAPGHDHAEVVAIQDVLSRHSPDVLREATLYVTLEPCCHHGRTPPCTDLIIKYQLKQVIYSEGDPNPRVAGQGAEALRQAGIDCQTVRVPAITAFYQSYRYWWRTQRPWVTAKLAVSLDGKTALAQHEPLMMTGSPLNAYTHACRKRTDAILTTARTVCIDNPQLNARCHTAEGEPVTYKKPLYILDSALSIPSSSRVFTTADSVILLHHPGVAPQRIQSYSQLGDHVRCVAVPILDVTTPLSSEHLLLDLNHVVRVLGEAGHHDVWVEAGGRCFQSLIESGCVQRALLYVAPVWLGSQAVSAFSSPLSCLDPSRLDKEAIRHTWFHMGKDAVLDIQLF